MQDIKYWKGVIKILAIKKMFKNILIISKLCKHSVITARKMSSDATDVIFETIHDKGIIILNRPKALNSLNLSMVKKLLPTLVKWEKEKSLVIVKGAGDKAFCAGGDVKSIAIAGMKGEKLGQEFFKHEYTMNGVIGTYKIPYIAFIDGICMGGGVGMSVHGRYRIATERTLFAMPETQIGLFPDVGGSYFLPRLGGKLGLYLALTGERLKGHDTVKAGIATHYIDSKSLLDLQEALLRCKNEHEIESTLKKFAKEMPNEFSLSSYLGGIEKCFSAPTVEEIIKRLEEEGSEWSKKTINQLKQMSPTSLKVTKEIMDRGAKLPLMDCLQMEYNVACNTMARKEFYEGVRALLIDKDKNPKWNPPALEEVSQSVVEEHFRQAPETLFPEIRNKL